MKYEDVPSFGSLHGVKVVVSAVSTAGPFAGELFAENGADVIWLESPKGIDPYRWTQDGWGVQNERRNMRNLMLDVVSPEGHEAFLKLMESTDIFIEASRGGQWEKWGYSDEVLWEHNPKLVIGHMSGYGMTGDPDYVSLPGYDFTVNAFSGLMYLNGYKDGLPYMIQKFVTDYYAGLFAYGSALAAYVGAQKTGRGDSFDLAQYEAAVRCQAGLYSKWFDKRIQEERGAGAPRDSISAGAGYYQCADGEGVYLFTAGQSTIKRAVEFFGLEYGSELFPEGIPSVALNSPGAPVFDAAIEDSLCGEYFPHYSDGLDHPVEEGGANLSGGQKQRLLLARALLSARPILVLDDATSALDYKSDLLVRRNIKKRGNLTTILVSQRATSIKDCDRIYVLDAGSIVGVGKHEELLSSCPVYREIYEAQVQAR